MSKACKIWLIVAASLVVAGLAVFAVGFAMSEFDIMAFVSAKAVENTCEIRESFESVSIDLTTADVKILPSDDGACRVISSDAEKISYEVRVSNNELVITRIDNRKWYDHIQIGSLNNRVTVYLPKDQYTDMKITVDTADVSIPKDFSFENVTVLSSTGDVCCKASASELLRVKTATGDIDVEGVSAGKMELSVSSGAIMMKNAKCGTDLSIISSTGDVTLERVVATGKFNINTGTGDVEFDRCDASEISVKTSTGDVEGSLLTDKTFDVETSTGKVNVPKNTTGGICRVKTSTGDINLWVQK